MNTLQLKQLLSTLLADSSSNFFTDDERIQALNLACSYVNGEVRILRDVAEITVTPLDSKVPIPADFVSLGKGITWKDTNGQLTQLERRVPIQLQAGSSTWETDTGTPAFYVLEGGNIYLTPTPNTTGTLLLSYVAMPNTIVADTDVPFYGDPRVQSYHDMLAFYAAWMLTLKDRDFEASDKFMQYFQSRMIDLKENLKQTGDVSIQPVWSDTYSTG